MDALGSGLLGLLKHFGFYWGMVASFCLNREDLIL